jgi:hypothetical protein
MPGPFTVTAATNSVQLNPDRQGEAAFTVFNGSGRAIRGQARLEAEDPAAAGWLSLEGESERDFDIAAAHQYAVRIQVPPDAPSGSYPFRLDMVGVEDPDEEYTEGPTVTFQVPEPQPEKEPFPWWIIAVVAGVLVIGGVIIAILLTDGDATVTVPGVRGETLTEATTLIEDAGLQVAGETRQEASDDVAANRIIGTDPPAGRSVDRDTEVTLIVSSGPAPITPTVTATPTPTPTQTATPTPTYTPTPTPTEPALDQVTAVDPYEGASPDFRRLTVAYTASTIEVIIELNSAGGAASANGTIYMYATENHQVKFSPGSFDVRRDAGKDGHFEESVTSGTPGVSGSTITIRFSRSAISDIGAKRMWGYFISSEDRIPDSGEIRF